MGDDAGLEGAEEGFRLEAVVDHHEADWGFDDLLVGDADDLVDNGAEEVAIMVVWPAEDHAGNVLLVDVLKEEALVFFMQEAFFFKSLQGA